MEKITLKIRERKKQYPIIIGCDVVEELKRYIDKNHKGKKIVMITDVNVVNAAKGYLEKAAPLFHDLKIITLPFGEQTKSRAAKAMIEDKLIEENYGRDTLLIAFGGGVIGDLTGFIAATYNRGIPFVQVPTSLLAMVDSSIGGKTGVNTEHGKNLIGAFHQPDSVIIDVELLDTLPEEELKNGLVEVIKIACVLDKNLFVMIEKHRDDILNKNKEILQVIIKKSLELKKKVVELDEQESGLRKILNLGHTVGHALEYLSNYTLKHGFAVAIGIIAENKAAVEKGLLDKTELERIEKLFISLGLETRIPAEVNANSIIKTIKKDKKVVNGNPQFILLEKIGKVYTTTNNIVSHHVDEELIKRIIQNN